MALINVTVVSERSAVLPWKISSEKESIREYYYCLCTGTAVLNGFTLTKAYLGRSKDALDLVDLDVELHQAVTVFGPFLKFIVDGSSESACTTTLGTSAQSVVEVLMNSQRSLKLPSEITKENKTFCLMM